MKQILSFVAVCAACVAPSVVSADSPIRPGDRIAIVGNTFADQLRIHGYLESLLLQSTLGKPVSIRNLGWGGDMLTARDRPTNFPTEAETLTAHKTDVIIACFGLGESFAGSQHVDAFRGNLKTFIEAHKGKIYNGQSEVRLILVSPIAYEDLGDLTPAREQRNLDLQTYTAAMRDVAAEQKVPFVDLYAPSLYLMDEPAGPNLTSNGIHLNHYGYWAISRSFLEQLVDGDKIREPVPWRLSVDATSKVASGRGVQIANVRANDDGVSFLVTETSAPGLPPPVKAPLPAQLQFQRDTLQVENLPPGTYRLTVDRKPVASGTANAWSEGIPIDSSPAHQAAEELRMAINDKNLQFTYSWKALNQVHIVGERKSSPSGRALPQEVVEFNRLANERDAKLSQSVQRKTRRWQLSRVAD